MTAWLSLLSIAMSALALAYLRATDAKRRRLFGLPPVTRRFAPVAKLAIWLPGVALGLLGNVAALVIWMGATTVVGWGIASLTPQIVMSAAQSARSMRAALAAHTSSMSNDVGSMVRSMRRGLAAAAATENDGEGEKKKIALLEAQIAELEAEIARRDAAMRIEHDLEAPQVLPPSLAIAGSHP
ncbi:MAG: FlxA-like family protein [Pseudomonadota bacterium]